MQLNKNNRINLKGFIYLMKNTIQEKTNTKEEEIM